jgi:glutaredoxin
VLDRLFKKAAPPTEDATLNKASAGETGEIALYTTNWCPSCRMAKSFLQQRGLNYQEIDIEAVPEAAEQVVAWTRGYKTVPTMRVGKVVVIDWNRRDYEKALAEAGY